MEHSPGQTVCWTIKQILRKVEFSGDNRIKLDSNSREIWESHKYVEIKPYSHQ